MSFTSHHSLQVADEAVLAVRYEKIDCTRESHVLLVKHESGTFHTRHSIENPGIGAASSTPRSSMRLRSFFTILVAPLNRLEVRSFFRTPFS